MEDALIAATPATLILITLAILFFLAPLGIWNRLIKIHRDNKAASEAILKQLEAIAEHMGAEVVRVRVCDVAYAAGKTVGSAVRVVKTAFAKVGDAKPSDAGKYSSIRRA